jgi:iron(II)-dependent oxidoreductase
VDVEGGPAMIGAPADGFAYDNERPRHEIDLPAFAIARTPLTNATWLSFTEGGGYERREWWSNEGWAWKEEYDIGRHAGAEAGPPDAAVVHVAWYEADAFARSVEARLPTEHEWEKAALLGRLKGVGSAWEWTQSHFTGYPGFRAHPYREYSEVFFGDRYRVLRGASRATHPRVASVHFRNWDLPGRRQLFAGVRIAR